jgi:hypothetical protein
MQHLSLKVGAFLLLVALSACGGGGASVSSNGRRADAPITSAPRLTDAVTVSPQAAETLAIDAASPSAVSNWIADADYSGGSEATVYNTINTSVASNPAPQAVYQTQRYARSFTYTIPNLTAYGAYTVRLHLAETFWTAAGKRVFGATVNGTQVLSNFDIFVAAGGVNRAITKQFSTSADSAGKIIILFTATVDNASLAGIEIIAGSGSSTPVPATPTPSPSTAPTPTGGGTMPWVYSELWSTSSPFKMTVAQQKSRGATILAHTYMDSLWSQGIAGNGTAEAIPIYVAKTSDTLVTTVCTMYGGNCNANNVQIHFPSYAVAQQASDGHVTVVDQNAPSGAIEIDCWQAARSGSRLSCSWAGLYHLGGLGMSVNGSSAIHGGMAVTSVYAVGQEFVNGHIDHALGMATSCLNNATVYPADTSVGSDATCSGSTSPPHYGDLMHLVWSSSLIASSSYSAPCKVILTALATYGAYLNDTGNNGLQINVHNELSYTANSATKSLDPWPGIQSQLNATGDGNGQGWYSCLNRIHSSDFELLEVKQ